MRFKAFLWAWVLWLAVLLRAGAAFGQVPAALDSLKAADWAVQQNGVTLYTNSEGDSVQAASTGALFGTVNGQRYVYCGDVFEGWFTLKGLSRAAWQAVTQGTGYAANDSTALQVNCAQWAAVQHREALNREPATGTLIVHVHTRYVDARPLRRDLASWWKMDSTNDSHGTNHLQSSGTGHGPGVVGQAAYFHADSTGGLFGSNPLNTGSFTVNLWFRYRTMERAAVFGTSGPRSTGVYAFHRGNGVVQYVTSDGTFRTDLRRNVPKQEFTMLTFILDRTAGEVRMGVNGVLTRQDLPAGFGSVGNGHRLAFGRRADAWAGFLTGAIDEAALWHRALTVAEVQLLHNGGVAFSYEVVNP